MGGEGGDCGRKRDDWPRFSNQFSVKNVFFKGCCVLGLLFFMFYVQNTTFATLNLGLCLLLSPMFLNLHLVMAI